MPMLTVSQPLQKNCAIILKSRALPFQSTHLFKTWTIEYDRDALAKHVDYIAVMSYDEHYAGSTIPGSVSSLPFVIDAIEGCLEEGVPPEKLLMGVPLYTRVWVVDEKRQNYF